MCQAGMEGETMVKMGVKGAPAGAWHQEDFLEEGGTWAGSWRRWIDTEGEGRLGPMYRGGAAGKGGRDMPEEETGQEGPRSCWPREKLQFVLRVNRKSEGMRCNSPMAPRFHIRSARGFARASHRGWAPRLGQVWVSLHRASINTRKRPRWPTGPRRMGF